MGRRPDVLVGEFFERGAKVANNRYHHTCRRCGEEFPKGRVDGLTGHLLRKCPNVTNADRQRVYEHIQSQSEGQVTADGGSRKQSSSLLKRSLKDSQQDTAPASYQPHEQSALDTLAEVSRRHLDYSSQTVPVEGQIDGGGFLSDLITERALISELTEQQPQDLVSEALDSVDTTPLIHAATAASRQLELAQSEFGKSLKDDLLLDPELENHHQPVQPLTERRESVKDSQDQSAMIWTPTLLAAGSVPSKSPAMIRSQPIPGFGLLQRPTSSKKRGRFDDARRKEVSEIRKRGACIRCRMLKKPCSGETPCSTCSSLGSARLWKSKCLRTRLADEFALWSMQVFHARAHFIIAQATKGVTGESIPGQIKVQLVSRPEVRLTLSAKQLVDQTSDLERALRGDLEEQEATLKEIIILDEIEDIVEELSVHISQMCDVWIETDSSNFMRATLQHAKDILQSEKVDTIVDEIKNQASGSPRSCYTLQTSLLRNVVELWTLTQLLIQSAKAPWSLRFSRQQTESERNTSGGEAHDGTVTVDQSTSDQSHSYRAVTAQLSAAVESRGNKLSRSIMNELERRLLQRQQVSRFTTFLSAVILLNCVERMCGLYRSIDAKDLNNWSLGLASGGADDDGSRVDASRPPPGHVTNEVRPFEEGYTEAPTLAQSPTAAWSQGQQFSELLNLLLRMRALPPRTYIGQGGILTARLAIDMGGQNAMALDDEQSKAAATWLDPMQLTVAEVMKKREEPLPDHEQGVEAWDMRFISHLLLPEETK